MKYLSIEDCKTWEPWDQIQENIKRYHEYIHTIWHLLPSDLQRLCDFSPGWSEKHISLNDSQVQQISMSHEARTVTFVLNGDYADENGKQVGLRRFILNYKDIALCQIHAGEENAYNPGPDWEAQTEEASVIGSSGIGFDDHIWDEIEIADNGLFEPRMLFASGTEVVMRFRDFKLETVDAPHETK